MVRHDNGRQVRRNMDMLGGDAGHRADAAVAAAAGGMGWARWVGSRSLVLVSRHFPFF